MGTLRETLSNPTVVEDTVERVSIQRQGVQAQKAALEKQLQEWEALKNTKLYHILGGLVDPMIFHLGAELAKTVLDYPDEMSLDKITEYRAECRGELRVWQSIKYGPGSLKTQLNQLDELEKREEERRKGPSEEVKNKLSNYA